MIVSLSTTLSMRSTKPILLIMTSGEGREAWPMIQYIISHGRSITLRQPSSRMGSLFP